MTTPAQPQQAVPMELVEAVARGVVHAPMPDGDGLCVWLDESWKAECTANMKHGPEYGRAEANALLSECYTSVAKAALTALCTARPDIAAVLRGEAVVVPREADKDNVELACQLVNAFYGGDDRGPNVVDARWMQVACAVRAMLAAAPQPQETQG